jgi:hypothetical protein
MKFEGIGCSPIWWLVILLLILLLIVLFSLLACDTKAVKVEAS